MKILLITQLFQPEPNHLKGLAFANKLVELGHQVEVLTGFPNYPGGNIYPGYKQKWWLREKMGGVTVIRVPIYPDHSSSGIRRILCYASLALTACFPGFLLIQKPDVIHVYQGPATLALPAMLLSVLCKVPYVLDVQDLWPESVLSSGMIKLPFVAPLLNTWCNLTYRLAGKIVALSAGYKSVLINRGVPESKVEVVYNWCDDAQMLPTQAENSAGDAFGLSGRFNVIYAGNLGTVQALDAVLGAARILLQSYPAVQFVFVGDGVDSNRLINVASELHLTNVKFVPRQPIDKVGAILSESAALLIHLRDDPLCRIGIPQKTQAYLAAGKPIIMAVRGEAAELVRKAAAGVLCEPEDAQSIASAVVRIYEMSDDERNVLSKNGREYYCRYLSFSVGSHQMELIFRGVLNG